MDAPVIIVLCVGFLVIAALMTRIIEARTSPDRFRRNMRDEQADRERAVAFSETPSHPWRNTQ